MTSGARILPIISRLVLEQEPMAADNPLLQMDTADRTWTRVSRRARMI
jgi:hypothetical protein